MDRESLCSKEIGGAPGRTQTSNTRFRKPMAHDPDNPIKWTKPDPRLTYDLFVFPPIRMNLHLS